MKEQYLELMEKALSAYSDEHILRYFNDVKEKGLTEHGFPRLTANIGILIAHGRRRDLLPIFVQMMDICCEMFLRPYVKAANEFSVREIVLCIEEIEAAGAVDEDAICRWKEQISKIVADECYNVIVKDETDRITNWAIFGAVSECARLRAGLGGDPEFVDRQLSCQFQWIDENGMYLDNAYSNVHQPMVYDLVSRGLFTMLLHFGYRGKYYEKIDDCLKKAGLLTLKMQSPGGEVPFGGRSNQFLHNEAWLAVIFEYEANRYAKEGKLELAMEFKAAVARALDVTRTWLDKTPIRHVKNRFPTETKYGCEEYAYFDKYMITVASFLYAAYRFCDDSIPTVPTVDHKTEEFLTSYHFHKLFLKSGGYMAELDTHADLHYDASGLGRIHREGAPAALCLSVPCPPQPAKYMVDIAEPMALSICAGIREDGEWRFAVDSSVAYEVTEHAADDSAARATVLCRFSESECVKTQYTVGADGVSLALEGTGEIACLLPAFAFDGESDTEIAADGHSLTVSYGGWMCRYTADGTVTDTGKPGANRNGHYRAFLASAENTLNVKIEIVKM